MLALNRFFTLQDAIPLSLESKCNAYWNNHAHDLDSQDPIVCIQAHMFMYAGVDVTVRPRTVLLWSARGVPSKGNSNVHKKIINPMHTCNIC